MIALLNLFNSQAVPGEKIERKREVNESGAAPKSKKSDTNARVISEICNCTGLACMVIGSSD